MTSEKRQVLVIGITGCLIGGFLCTLAIWLFYLASNGITYGITLLGLPLEGKVLAAVITWLGFVALFFSVRKIIRKKET
jgi:hypothetical protein